MNHMDLSVNYDEIKIKIDNFLRQGNFENNIYDEINKYISLYNKNYKKDEKKLFDKYMKITVFFYAFFSYSSNKYIRTVLYILMILKDFLLEK